MDSNERALQISEAHGGKLAVEPQVEINNRTDLAAAYSPGVAAVSRAIAETPDDVYKYTIKQHTVGVITDGSAVLGLGNIGPEAALPVMEGKAALFKRFAGIDAFPIALKTHDVDEIVNIVKNLTPVFGGINLEDIKAPQCFEIEERLKKETDIPIFHDDQHGTAIVVLAGLINALKLAQKDFADLKVVINGAGAAGVAIAKILLVKGVKDILVLDSKGIIAKDRPNLTNPSKLELAEITNQDNIQGDLHTAIKDADVFIGVSVANVLKKEWIQEMAAKPILFAMANPDPEISVEDAKAGGAFVIGTGRSDYPNQVNNVLAFPGIFKGALAARASEITEAMKLAAAEGIANIIPESELNPDNVLPDIFDERVTAAVAKAVQDEAEK